MTETSDNYRRKMETMTKELEAKKAELSVLRTKGGTSLVRSLLLF